MDLSPEKAVVKRIHKVLYTSVLSGSGGVQKVEIVVKHSIESRGSQNTGLSEPVHPNSVCEQQMIQSRMYATERTCSFPAVLVFRQFRAGQIQAFIHNCVVPGEGLEVNSEFNVGHGSGF